MKKLERISCILALTFAVVAFTGGGLDKRAIIHETDRTISSSMLYGGIGTSAISILVASYASGRNNKKKKDSNRDYTN